MWIYKVSISCWMAISSPLLSFPICEKKRQQQLCGTRAFFYLLLYKCKTFLQKKIGVKEDGLERAKGTISVLRIGYQQLVSLLPIIFFSLFSLSSIFQRGFLLKCQTVLLLYGEGRIAWRTRGKTSILCSLCVYIDIAYLQSR